MTINNFHINSIVFNNIKDKYSNNEINTIEDITSISLLSTAVIINGWAKVPYCKFY